MWAEIAIVLPYSAISRIPSRMPDTPSDFVGDLPAGLAIMLAAKVRPWTSSAKS